MERRSTGGPYLTPFFFPLLAPFCPTVGVMHMSTGPPHCCPLATLESSTHALVAWEKAGKALEAASGPFA